jgi:hypothetical protein
MQLAPDGRQRDVHDAEVELQHELGGERLTLQPPSKAIASDPSADASSIGDPGK